MNVGAEHVEVHWLPPVNDYRFVSPLKQMAKNFVPAIVALGVSPLQPFHSRDEISLGRLDQQMIMIAHQHAGMDTPTGLLASFFQGFQESFAIRMVGEDRLPVTASSHH